jgi:F-type H+-transporting ATPase subunit delta
MSSFREFIDLLKKNDMYEQLPEIVSVLQAEVLRNQDITVTTAEILSDDERRDLTNTLTKQWGEHRVVFTVDSVVLSGLMVTFQDKIIDMSGRGKLAALAQELK